MTAVKKESRIDREEAARAARPRTRTIQARPSGKKVDIKAFHEETKRRFPVIMRYLAEH